jgi:hypothetical protein
VPDPLPSYPAPPGSPPSGDTPSAVATAVLRLDTLGERPVSEHVEVFDEVHRLLQDALAALDEA